MKLHGPQADAQVKNQVKRLTLVVKFEAGYGYGILNMGLKGWGAVAACALWAGLQAGAISIGPGPVIGTNKNPNVPYNGGGVWYQEFQDWKASDLRALDTNADNYSFPDGSDTSRDLVAFYSHDDGTNIYFRFDFFDLGFGAETNRLDVYVAIDCMPGSGNSNLPDNVETVTDHPWEVVVAVYDSQYKNLYDTSGPISLTNYLGSYWRSDLDGVEFGIKRSVLTNRGWDGVSPFHLQAYTCKDNPNGVSGEIANGSDLVDSIGTLIRNAGTGRLEGGVLSSAGTGRAKYAVIAHANQSVATKGGTQGHIFTDRSDIGFYPGFIRLIDSAEMLNVPMNLHISGTLLMSFQWATQNPVEAGYPNRDGPTFLNRVKKFVTPGQGPGSLVGGVLAEHIMPYFEGEVNRKSIAQNTELVQNLFGLGVDDMKVMHIPERVFHTNTNSPYVNPAGPIKGKPFEDIVASGFPATYLDEVTHLHWWFYPNETNNAGWDTNACGRWAGGQGNDEEPYHHKVHKINGVYCFMINDREDQEKFGNDGDGMQTATRYVLLQKARSADSSQLTLVFDDWEAFAGNSFASSTPNNNADQWDRTIRWAANHPWIELVNLKDVLGWALADPTWVVDHGYVYDKSSQTYEWLKRASEQSYDHWYYGSMLETSFYHRVPPVKDSWVPGGMKKYGDLNTTNTLMRDSWDRIQAITAPALKKLAEWSYSAMIYETAWHDEDANPDQYKSRNYQVDFNRGTAQGNCDTSVADTTYDKTSGWALKLHGHVRDMGVMKAASDWVQQVKDGTQGAAPTVYAADLDDDQLWEYVICNNRVFLCFERWGARLVKAFVFDPDLNGGDAVAVVGVSVSNPPEETENEGVDNNRCSAFKDRFCSGQNDAYVDMDFAATAPVMLPNGWQFVSEDGRITKVVQLEPGREVVQVEYRMDPAVGTLYTRYGLGPNQLDLMVHGHSNLVGSADASYRGLRNTQGGAAYVVAGRNVSFINRVANAGWDHREMPLLEQYETQSGSTNWTVALAFSESAARDLDGDGLNNTNEFLAGTDHEKWDTDGDHMPDGYEVANGLAGTVNDAWEDSDGDRMANWAEYIAGTAAGSSNSYFALAAPGLPGASFLIRHSTASGRLYEVLFSDDLAHWQSFADTNMPVGRYLESGAGAQHTFTDDYSAATSGSAPTNGVRAYGIRVIKP